MLKKILIAAVVLGAIVGGYIWVQFQLSFSDRASLPTTLVDGPALEELKEELVGAEVLKKGAFNKLDIYHFGTGVATIEDLGDDVAVHLPDNFFVVEGPDLYLMVAPEGNEGKPDIANGALLGLMPTNKGEQYYRISKETFEANDYAVVVRCRALNFTFSYAILN